MEEAKNQFQPARPCLPTGRQSGGDETLVKSYKNGHPEALESLLSKYEKPLFNYIYGVVREANRAQDIFQETWLSLLKSMGGFEPAGTGSFKRWLYTIALNKCRDFMRSMARTKVVEEKLMQYTKQATSEESTGFGDAVRQAIERLPQEQKEVILLRIDSGLTFKEIASLLDCPLNTVLGRMHYAVNSLRNLLGGDN